MELTISRKKRIKPFHWKRNNRKNYLLWNSSNSREENKQERKFKFRRAQGECLGTGSRWRTRQAAKSCGELQISLDPQISEWGNSHDEESWNVYWIHSLMKGTPRTETSKYQEEEKSTEISQVVASESERGQTESSNTLGVRTSISNPYDSRMVWENQPKRVRVS